MTTMPMAKYSDAEIDELMEMIEVAARARQEQKKKESLLLDKDKLAQTLIQAGPLPEEGLFIGIAADGLPILLDIDDPTPGAMLFVSDKRSGKTLLLKTIAASIELTHKPENVKFAVLTDNVDDWEDLQNSPNRIGIFSFRQSSINDFINGLTTWAHMNNDASQTIVLLIDGVHNIEYLDPLAQDNLAWLLEKGAGRRVWTIGTAQADTYQNASLVHQFNSHIFGRITSGTEIQDLRVPPRARQANWGQFLLTDDLSFSVSAVNF